MNSYIVSLIFKSRNNKDSISKRFFPKAKSRYFVSLLLLLLSFVSLAETPKITGSIVVDDVAPISVLVVGDSLSAAYKLPVAEGWVALINDQYRQEGVFASLANASVSGITTSGGLRILPNALKQHQPQIVVIELGANDGLQGKKIASITENLSQLITLSQASGAKVLLLGVRLPPNRGSRYTEPFYKQYEQLARLHQIALVPFFMEGVAGNARLMMDDGLHPNALGQKTIAGNVREILDGLLNFNEK